MYINHSIFHQMTILVRKLTLFSLPGRNIAATSHSSLKFASIKFQALDDVEPELWLKGGVYFVSFILCEFCEFGSKNGFCSMLEAN